MIHHREALETAWRTYRTQRRAAGYYVNDGLRTVYERAWEDGRKVGQQEERERLQQTLPMG